MPSQAYFVQDGVGDWYACIAPASAGESPATAPDKWVRLEIPAIFEGYLVEKATELLLVGDGQMDKRRAAARAAEEVLTDLGFRHADRGEFERPRVLTR